MVFRNKSKTPKFCTNGYWKCWALEKVSSSFQIVLIWDVNSLNFQIFQGVIQGVTWIYSPKIYDGYQTRHGLQEIPFSKQMSHLKFPGWNYHDFWPWYWKLSSYIFWPWNIMQHPGVWPPSQDAGSRPPGWHETCLASGIPKYTDAFASEKWQLKVVNKNAKKDLFFTMTGRACMTLQFRMEILLVDLPPWKTSPFMVDWDSVSLCWRIWQIKCVKDLPGKEIPPPPFFLRACFFFEARLQSGRSC